jgi:carbamoyltransferase
MLTAQAACRRFQGDESRYWRLIDAFREASGVPMVLNTSFNENEPVVNHPNEAIDCFARTRMDTLVVGKAFLRKSA